MSKYKKPPFDPKKIGKNPFVVQLRIPVREILYEKQFKLVDGVLVNVIAEVEHVPFVRLYSDPTHRKEISGLSTSAKELFMWIMYEIKYGEDFIWVNKERFMAENHTSINTYKKAVQDLVKCIMISYTVVKDVFYINPEYFFKGDRVSKYPNNVVKVGEGVSKVKPEKKDEKEVNEPEQ